MKIERERARDEKMSSYVQVHQYDSKHKHREGDLHGPCGREVSLASLEELGAACTFYIVDTCIIYTLQIRQGGEKERPGGRSKKLPEKQKGRMPGRASPIFPFSLRAQVGF